MSEFLDDINQAGTATLNYWRGDWVRDATMNWQVIKRGLASGRMIDIVDIPRVIHAPGYMLCSGPSLDDTPWADLAKRQAEGAGIIAATSNLTAALAHGITPDYVVVVDANPILEKQIKPVVDLLAKTTLLTSPLIEPRLLKMWPGPIAIFKPMQHGDEFVTNILPRMYSTRHEIDANHRFFVEWINAAFLNAGCVSNAMLLALAFIGYEPIFMLGNDLGFPAGKQRCTSYTRDVDGSWVADKPGPITVRELLRTANNGVRTISEYLHYKLNLFIAWRLTPVQLWNCSSVGVIRNDEVPYVGVEAACGEIDGTDANGQQTSVLGWQYAASHYPLDPGSLEWVEHLTRITSVMGMKIISVPGGFQVSIASTPGKQPLSLPPTGVMSTRGVTS